MRKAGAVVVGNSIHKYLGFIFKSAKAATVENTISISGKAGASRVGRLGMKATEGVRALASIRVELPLFGIFPIFSRKSHRQKTINDVS